MSARCTSGSTPTVLRAPSSDPSGLSAAQVKAREVILVIDPGRIGLGVLLLFLAGRFGILGPQRELFAIRGWR